MAARTEGFSMMASGPQSRQHGEPEHHDRAEQGTDAGRSLALENEQADQDGRVIGRM
jgi:hypothetical protein